MLHYVFLLNFLNKLNTLHTPHKESSDSLQKLNCKLFIYLFPLFFFLDMNQYVGLFHPPLCVSLLVCFQMESF